MTVKSLKAILDKFNDETDVFVSCEYAQHYEDITGLVVSRQKSEIGDCTDIMVEFEGWENVYTKEDVAKYKRLIAANAPIKTITLLGG